jgi:signal transduction histidine kinase
MVFVIFCLIHYRPKFFSFVGLIIAASCLLLAFIILVYSNRKVHLIWSLFNLAVVVWGVGCFLIGISGHDYNKALVGWKIFVLGITFIPVFCYHFVSEYCYAKSKWFLLFCYIQGIVFSTINLSSSLLVSKITFLYGEFYYLNANVFYTLFFIIWSFIVFISFNILFQSYWISSGIRKVQSGYLFFGMLIGFLGGGTTAPLAWGIPLYPSGHFLTVVYAAISTYAIFKYQLIDLKTVFTRIGVFVAVYSFVLGIPIASAFGFRTILISFFGENWWAVPLITSTILATVGPFIYLYIQKRAEEQLLKEQRRYQSTLSQASAGMGRIKDLKRLLELIVYIITRAVRLDHSSVYIFDQNKSKYLLGAYKRNVAMKAAVEVGSDSPLVQHLIKTKAPVVYEEIKQRVQDYNDAHLAKIEDSLKQLDAALVIPSLIEDRLLALLVLGKKKSGKLYGEDDLSVFSILANQAALAIENAQFYEDVKKTQEQLFQAEKMATIGTMADGLSHQINNRLHALGFIAGDALDTIKLKRGAAMSDEIKGIMNDLERSLVRIQENVLQGGEIVQGLLRYTRKGDIGFAPVEIDKLVTAALEMAQFKIKTHEMKILREYDKNGPKIKGNFTQLQEVFFNMIDNAYDAMMQRKNEQKEAGFQPTLRIQALVQGDRIIIKFLDNGIGVKPEDFQKIFTPFFTTKLSSKKGTGLGLYVIKKIIDDNHKGKVTFESQYMQGTTMILNLPIAH